ncbi:uncharacterized protein LOC126906340 isoform X2 [Daktulosphaira vitifoliae]|uniref:uncharacterized protein LOC126906340 isoform X2 n=1 Tax=Daktulosphaira vitifoliae TaxID=58002 RepID=UPI0021AA3F49|nr:uncharacterized protein LOC126906340 isoform X2 [Daktulosphaira vitifoliae]
MSLLSLTSDQVKQFLPLHTWTPVFIIPGNKANNDEIYKITTNENYLRMCQDIHKMAMLSHTFCKVKRFKMFELVAVELEGMWCRGRMLSYNEFLTNNTIVAIIDTGLLIEKSLNVLYNLPEDLKYDPLCIAIKPVNDIPNSRKFYVKPLLSKSELYKGYVLVELKNCNEEINNLCIEPDLDLVEVENIHVSSNIQTFDPKINEMSISKISKNSMKCKQKEKLYDNLLLNSFSEEFICNPKNKSICSTKESYNKFQIHACLDKSNLKEYMNFVFSNVLQEVLQIKKGNTFQDIHDFGANLLKHLTINIPFKMDHNYLTFVKPVNENIKYKPEKIKTILINFSSDILKLPVNGNQNLNKINNEITSRDQQNVFNIPSKSVVEFCYGSNVDFVYVNFVEQKKKFEDYMNNFFAFYNNNDNKMNKYNPERGDLVAAFLPLYKEVHRALILNRNTTNSKLYLCYFVDIGCKHYIYSKFIYELSEDAKQIPYLAHRVGLKGMKTLNNTSKLNYLKIYFKKLYRKHLNMYYDENDKDGLNKVVLMKCDNDVDICQEINNFLDDSNYLKNKVSIQKKNSNTTSYRSMLKCSSMVVIAHFESIKKLYVRILSDESINSFNNLMKKMEDYFCNIKGVNVRRNPKVGEKLGVRSSMNIILRGIICQKVNENCFLVFYMDFGSIEYIEGKNLFELPYELRCIPQTVIKIGINLTTPVVALPEQITNYFNMLISSSTPLFVVFVDENDPRGYKNVLLTKDGIDLCQDINYYCSSI